MAYHKRTIKNGSICIDGCDIAVAEIEDNISVVWIRAWYRLDKQYHPTIHFHLDDCRTGITPFYVKAEGEMIEVGFGQLPLNQCHKWNRSHQREAIADQLSIDRELRSMGEEW